MVYHYFVGSMQRTSSRVDMDTAEYSRTSSSDILENADNISDGTVMLVDNAVKEVCVAIKFRPS